MVQGVILSILLCEFKKTHAAARIWITTIAVSDFFKIKNLQKITNEYNERYWKMNKLIVEIKK